MTARREATAEDIAAAAKDPEHPLRVAARKDGIGSIQDRLNRARLDNERLTTEYHVLKAHSLSQAQRIRALESALRDLTVPSARAVLLLNAKDSTAEKVDVAATDAAPVDPFKPLGLVDERKAPGA
jgi:hypothetical protein